MTFRQAIEYLGNNKKLSAREAVVYGITSFGQIIKLIIELSLKNDTNRFEELVTKKDYKNKAKHMLPFVDKICSKGIILATIFRDKTTKSAFIRDCGTMIGLFTKFYDKKVLTGNEWLGVIKEVKAEYNPSIQNQKFSIMISEYIESLSEQKKSIKISLKTIVQSSDEMKNYFMDTEIPFELNLFTTKEHTLDMQKANKTDKPWNPFDFIDTPCKSKFDEEYHNNFLGADLLEMFSEKDMLGTKKFPRGKFGSTLAGPTKSKRVWCLVPLYQSFMISRFVDDIQDLDTAAEMIARFNDVDEEKIYSYWNSKWEQMVKTTSYQDMVNFYEKEYLPVFQDDNWNQVTPVIKEIANQHTDGKILTALKGLHITKDHTAIYFVSLVLWMKQRYPKKAVDKIIKILVNNYITLLKGDVQHYNEDTKNTYNVSVGEYFGSHSDVYQSSSATQRVKKVFTSMPAHIDKELSKGKTDRSKQQTYRDSSKSKHYDSLTNASLPTILHLYPISSEDIMASINFMTGDNLKWIHSNHGENKAIDGFLGFDEDNKGDYVDFDWVEFGVNSQEDYWKKIIEHNTNIMNNSSDQLEKTQINIGLTALATILMTDLEVK
jgi:hypothetical protein